jgi:DNA-binding NarL/FixJ family response regulator
MAYKKRIYIVEGHPIVRLGLKRLLTDQGDLDVCGEADSLAAAEDGIAGARPDLVLLDLSLKSGEGGFELIRRIHARDRFLPVLVVSMHDESLFADRVLRTGARGYIMKSEATRHLIQAIRTVLAGEIYLSAAETARVLKKYYAPNGSGLTQKRLSVRELEVIQMIGQGLSSRQIAEALHLSVKTIETHRAHILKKLNLADAAELKSYALQLSEAPVVRLPRAVVGRAKRSRTASK